MRQMHLDLGGEGIDLGGSIQDWNGRTINMHDGIFAHDDDDLDDVDDEEVRGGNNLMASVNALWAPQTVGCARTDKDKLS